MTGTRRSGPIDWSGIASAQLTPDIAARSISGEHLSTTLYSLASNAEVPEHAHPNDEFGCVIAGGLDVWTGSQHFELAPGDTFFIARDEAHRALATAQGCLLLECYSPPRIPTAPTGTRH